MGKKMIITISSIVLVATLGILGILLYKDYQSNGGIFGYKQLGMEKIEEVIPPEREGNIIISRQLGYKFTIPEGYELTEIGSADAWNGQDTYSEFFIVNIEKQHTLNVIIIPMDGDAFKDTDSEFDKEQILEATLKQVFLNFDEQLIVYKDYCGLSCGFYDGEVSNTKSDGTNWHMGEYVYVAPYAEVVFMVVRSEEDVEEMNMLFDCFETLE